MERGVQGGGRYISIREGDFSQEQGCIRKEEERRRKGRRIE